MVTEPVEARIRLYVTLVAICMWTGVIVELILAEHTEDWRQLIPFVVCGIGLAATIWFKVSPTQRTAASVRWVAYAAFVTAAAGVYLHLRANIEIELEVGGSAPFGQILWDSIFGASPMFAPGMIAVTAVLTLIVLYRHPNLR